MHEAVVNCAMDDDVALWGRWSSDGQTPAYLAATRMVALCDRNVAAIAERLRLAPGMRVLDVGCGSGEYCFRLGAHVSGVRFTGVDLDEAFVRFAIERAEGRRGYPYELPGPGNDYRFQCGDGSRLPFEDAAFDAVVSHTFLTAVRGWRDCLAEMKRVCKPGGVRVIGHVADRRFLRDRLHEVVRRLPLARRSRAGAAR